MSLRGFLSELEGEGEVYRVKAQVSPRFEAAAIIRKLEEKAAIYLEKIEGFDIPVVAGVCATRRRLFKALRVDGNLDFYQRLLEAFSNPSRCRVVDDGPVREVSEEPDLSKLPILTFYEGDGGPYLTAGLVYARSGGVENVSIHRLMVLDKRRLAIRIVPRHLYRLWREAREKGKPLDVAITVGVHPALMLAASSPAPFGTSEYEVANKLLGGSLKLVEGEIVEGYAPAEAEIFLEGRILPNVEVEEGPFTDVTGTYDAVRRQPVVEVLRVHRRRNPIYQTILPAGLEHRLLMGIGYEAKIWSAVRNVTPEVGGVNLTVGGCGWLHAVVAIGKQREGDGKNALMAAFAAHPSLKHVVVVDLDIDVYNLEMVEWALATRFQGDRDLLVLREARGSTLDPSASPEGLTTKLGFDATRPLNLPPEAFRRAEIPGAEEACKKILK
ncbi:MAG: UbiD family decarboxylase [Candidatus Hecatellales archaeon]|nr:MAG: UbiD family decarboxylase [Candidatus Hecatellales archaeon]